MIKSVFVQKCQRTRLEDEFQELVVGLARVCGWTVYHIPDSRKGTARGFPDLVIAKMNPSQVIVAELKKQKGIATKEQRNWINVFDDVFAFMDGSGSYIWKPSDAEEVWEILTSPPPSAHWLTAAFDDPGPFSTLLDEVRSLN